MSDAAASGFFSRLITGTRDAVRTEFSLFSTFPKLRLAVIVLALVPSAYALIYLTSVWDPNAKTSALPVGIVNLDQGVVYRGNSAQVGAELTASLMKKGNFGFRSISSAEEATEQVRRGQLAFAVIIPTDFSSLAVPGMHAGGARVRVVLSEGNNYSAAGVGRRFAVELGHQLNETLNEKRWALVLSSVGGAGQSVARLRNGVAQLKTGAQSLDSGVTRYASAAQQVSQGFKQVGAGVRTMESRWPADADVQALKSGAHALAQGQRELGKGLDQLHSGSMKLGDGATQMRDETKGIPFAGSKVSAGAGALANGANDLSMGLVKARDANAQLAAGAAQLETGTARLADGVSALGSGVKTLASRLPADADLDTFANSGGALAEGASRVLAGISMLEASLPKEVANLDGSAQGLAESVAPDIEVLAPVANNGSAFAPNMLSVALWIGAVMTATLFKMLLVLDGYRDTPRLARALGKLSAPSVVVLLQGVVLTPVAVFGLGLQVPHVMTFMLTMALASIVFLLMVFALQRVFGDVGKILAVLLLTLQLAAGGGVMPIELSGDFFRAVHDWLPFSWVVRAFRASLFDAFDGAWLHAWLIALAQGLVALVVGVYVGRWKFVTADNYVVGMD